MYSATAALKLVSAAGLAPAVPRFQAEHVAATPRAVRPNWLRSSRWGHTGHKATNLGNGLEGKIQKLALPAGLAPAFFPQTTGCFSVQLQEQDGLPNRSSGKSWWEVLVMLQSSLPACLKTPVLRTGSRITS
jgi:hypothetical protein